MSKNIFLNKIKSANGNIVYGAARIFLRKPYGSNELLKTKNVTRTTANGPTPATVTEVSGSLKVDDLLARQAKYFFGVDLPVDMYLNVRVTLWDKVGENFTRFPRTEGESVMFFSGNWKLTSFNRKDGSVGYQLEGSAYDFCALRSAQEQNQGASAAAKTAAPAQKAAPQTTQTAAASAQKAAAPTAYNAPGQYTAEDFAGVDESDDLPF